jgi:hypothetical protein
MRVVIDSFQAYAGEELSKAIAPGIHLASGNLGSQ